MQRSRGCATICPVEVNDAAETLRGHLLVAVPQLLDPNFHRAVVLLLQHDEDGAIGLVINQRASHSMLEVATGVGLQWRGDPEQPVGIGGPVERTRGWVIHDQADWDPHATDILYSLSLTTTLDGVKREGRERFGEDGGRFLFLLGYAGWGPGQIENEIASGSWVAVPVRDPDEPGDSGVLQDFIFEAAPDEMWRIALESLGIDPVRLVGMHTSDGLH